MKKNRRYGLKPRSLLCLFLIFPLLLSAQGKKININVRNKPIVTVLNQVRNDFGYRFLFNNNELNVVPAITISAKEMDVNTFMTELLKNTNLTFKIENGVVIISPKMVSKSKKIQIQGKVFDDTNTPVIGAAVSVKNSTQGTVSNEKGAFSLTMNAGDEILVSFVGYKTITKTITESNSNLTLKLQVEAMTLNDVVVTGYQNIDKRVLTSSIETIKAEDMDRIGALTVDQMLEGKVSGLMVTNLSSTPGAAAKIRVRSGGTFTGSREPLWVVDEMIYEDPVPLSADDINSYDNVNLIGNALTGINPQDIESINILKDASATAIYGTRASNGVIVVTTKRGKVGKASITYSGNVSIVDRPRYSDFNLMNSKERIDVSRDIMKNSLPFPETIISYVGYEGALRDYKLGLTDFNGFNSRVSQLETMNTDWFGELYRMAISQSHNINISGGNDNVKYYFSVGYNDDQGAERNVDVNRITARSNLDVRLRKNISLTVGVSGSAQEAKYNHNSINLFDEAFYNSRAVPIKNENGSLFYISKEIAKKPGGVISARYNILNEMEQSAQNVDNKDLNISTQLSWDLFPGVKLRASGSYRNTTNLTEDWITDKTFYVAKLRTYDKVAEKIDQIVRDEAMIGPFGGLITNGHTSQKSMMGKVQLNMSKTILSNHNFNLNIGYEANSVMHKGVSGWSSPGYNHTQGRSFIPLPAFTINSANGNIEGYNYAKMLSWLTKGSGMDIYPTVTDRINNSASAFLIFNYSFKNRYVFNFNARSDGSNRFGQYEKYKFKPTWSVSGRWNIYQESFMKNANWIDELSVRASYGFRGTPPSGTPYLVIKNYIENANLNEFTALMDGFPNSNLTWEKTSTLNLGLNHSWFGGRLSGAVDFAYSKGTDLLLSRPVSLANGQATQQYNGGSKQDYTYEFSLRGVILKTKDLGFNLGFNFTRIKEEILSGFVDKNNTLSVKNYLSGNIYLTGFPVDAFYSYKFNGLNDNGLPTFAGINNAPKSGTLAEYFENSLVYSGSRTPQYYGGINAEFGYKGVTVRASFSYKFGQKIRRLKLYKDNQQMPMPYENMSSEFNSRWRNPGDNTNIPALSSSSLTVGTSSNYDIPVWSSKIVDDGVSGWNMYDLSDTRVVDGSHIRVNNVTISYGLPANLLKKLNVNQLRASLQIANLGVITFDKDLKGQDPEQIASIGMPALPRYTLSLSFGF